MASKIEHIGENTNMGKGWILTKSTAARWCCHQWDQDSLVGTTFKWQAK